MKFQLSRSKHLRDICNKKLLFFGPYLRRAVEKIVGKLRNGEIKKWMHSCNVYHFVYNIIKRQKHYL